MSLALAATCTDFHEPKHHNEYRFYGNEVAKRVMPRQHVIRQTDNVVAV